MLQRRTRPRRRSRGKTHQHSGAAQAGSRMLKRSEDSAAAELGGRLHDPARSLRKDVFSLEPPPGTRGGTVRQEGPAPVFPASAARNPAFRRRDRPARLCRSRRDARRRRSWSAPRVPVPCERGPQTSPPRRLPASMPNGSRAKCSARPPPGTGVCATCGKTLVATESLWQASPVRESATGLNWTPFC